MGCFQGSVSHDAKVTKIASLCFNMVPLKFSNADLTDTIMPLVSNSRIENVDFWGMLLVELAPSKSGQITSFRSSSMESRLRVKAIH